MIAPFDIVVAPLDGVRGHRPKVRARCPAHNGQSASLSVRESSDGTIWLKCFSGCSAAAVLGAIGLQLGDLFPKRAERSSAEHSDWGNSPYLLATAPASVVADAIDRDIARRQAIEADRLGYEPPLASRIINAARVSVGLRFSRTLKPVAPFIWERCFPHCEDPLWPVLFERAIEEEVRARWHFLHPDAEPGDTDPTGHDAFDLIRAENRAAAEVRRMGRAA